MKKKAGQNLVNNIKTSKFLPSVFQTELNKNWLDSTLDQMVSKGPLEDLNGYIGSRGGKHAVSTDTYLEPKFHKALRTKNQLKPGVISYDNSNNVTNMITFDDIAHSINDNFATYNYNAAYASSLYSFNPPVDIDKLVNYRNYHWVEELPVYESIWTGASKNPITDIAAGAYTITDDTNTVTIETGMLIKFTGAGWHADVLNKTYLVSGSAGKNRLHEYFNTSASRVYNNTVKHTQATDGVYTSPKVFNVSPGTATTYTGSPEARVAAFNADAARLPIFNGFLFDSDIESVSNPTQLANNVFVKFTGSWTHGATNNTDIFSVTVDPTSGNVAIAAATTKELAGLTVSPTNTVMYNKGHPVVPLKDYIVIAKHDAFQSAWSRANHWVNISTINKLKTLLPTYDFSEILNPNRIALRPIIEYDAGLNMWDNAEYTGHTHLGAVDHGVTTAQSATIAAFAAGTTYVYIDTTDSLIHTVGGTDITLTENDTFSIKNSTNSLWNQADAYYINSKVTLAQQKTKINQYPLYRFYNEVGVNLENIAGIGFNGEKIFGYKEGTGSVNDKELGFPLSFKDTPKGAEYEFENIILTKNYLNSFKHVENDNLSHTKDQLGYTLFKQNDILKSIYAQSGKTAGASEHVQYEITSGDTPLAIPYGQSNWRPTQEYFIHSFNTRKQLTDQQLVITTVNSDGVENTNRAGSSEFYMIGVGQEFVLHNLTSDAITFSTQSEITTNTVGTATTITTSASSNNKQFDVFVDDGTGAVLLQTFFISDNWDKLFHKTTVNGKEVLASQETTTATTTTIDDSIFKTGDIVDFYWNNNSLTNKTVNTSLPDVLDHNVHNTPLSTFTISETLDHWASKLNAMPNFDGNTFGENNFASIPHTPNYGGTIFMSEDISIMNDINYSDNKLSITGALNEQANDYIGFRNRVTAQARRIFSTSGAATVQELADKSIQQVIKNKHDDGLYKDSNMLFTQTDNTQLFTTTDATTTTFKTRYTFNGDLNIRDHVYVYLTESSVRKLLIKDTEYTIIGDTVTLVTAPVASAVVEVYYSQMDEYCFIPPSMVKLGLAYGIEPQVNNNILYTHDGMQIDVTGKDIENINAGATFDPVNAVIFEMEKRIFAGLVKEDSMYAEREWSPPSNETTILARERYSSPVEFIPSMHASTWFTLNDLNNYLEKYYYQWARHNDITGLNTASYYDAADSLTWNYSTMTFDGINNLPGHYKGAYTHLFGTCTPHITPWHMLGHAFKPTWWDTHYTWLTDATGIAGDTAKRAALIDALKKGIVSNPENDNIIQVIKHARHAWDWAVNCPVTTAGILEDPQTVLGTPSNVAKEAAFVFGDWGPVEINWRSSANGQAMTVDAISKLVPAKAWTAFFQPGFISEHTSVISNVSRYNNLLPSTIDYKMPGEIYGSSIVNITLTGTNPPTTLESAGWFTILDDYDSTIGKARYAIDGGGATGSISSISLIERGLYFIGTPVLSYVGTAGAANDICVDLELKAIPFVSNGISQAQYNFILRNQHNISQAELYSNLTTKLQEKLSGFTSKHLLDISAESSSAGDFILGESDFNIEMYKGAVTDSITASAVLITKTLTGWKVSGLSNNNREFKFLEPNLVKSSDYSTQTIATQKVKRYNTFVSTPSILEYDATIEKIQDTYNFLRGYWEWMRTSGYTVAYDGDSSATDFVTWALTAEVSNIYILQLGREIKFKPSHGHVCEYNQLTYNNNDVLDTDAVRIQNSDLSISRTNGTVNIETKNKEFIGSITSAVLDYEHIVVFENKTKLGVYLFDDVSNTRQERLLVRGQRTSNWTGEKKAPGYLVVDNHIVQNFDSAVQSVDDIYRTDVNEFNNAFAKAKDLTIGNIDGQLLDGIGIDKNVLTNYYQGVITEKGTKGAIQHIGKSSLLSGDNSSISVFEQYMFRQSTLGNSDMEDPLEIEIVSDDINSSPQTISLSTAPTTPAANIIYKTAANTVNEKAITFNTLSYNDSSSDILTAGETKSNETKYQITNASSIGTAFDKTASYTKIPTWNDYTSYKKGEQVRHEGKLYNCIVDFTGLNIATNSIVVTGTATGVDFPFGTVAEIAGTSVTFEEYLTQYNDITAIGSVVNPTFLPSETLLITHSGTTVPIAFSNNVLVTTVTAGAELTGNTAPYTTPVAIADVTGKSITLNGIVVDFDTTPSNVIENFTGIASQTDFTIAQALSASTYSSSLVTVTVDGTAETGFTMTGQILTFTTAPAVGAAIVVTLVHVPNSMNATEIVDKINTYTGTSFVTASINTTGLYPLTLQLSRAMGLITDSIVLSASATNTTLGFPSGGTTAHPSSTTTLEPGSMTVTQIAAAINAESLLDNKIAASVSANKLVLTSTNNDSNGLAIAGTARTILGLNDLYVVSTTPIEKPTSMADAVTKIQLALTAASSTVTIVELGNAIVVTSPEASLTMGATTFNDIAGLITGTINAIGSTVENTFITSPADWAATDDDDALYNILVTNDSDFEIASNGTIITKFFGWNILQVQSKGTAANPLFTKSTDGSTCGICAGTTSKDGNDAEITTNESHMFQVGDFVQLLNTTTTPNIDGIHKITKLGIGTNADRIFYIDEFIEKCGNAVSVYPLVTTRFKDTSQRDDSITNTRWNLPLSTLVIASSYNSISGTYVYKTATGNTWTDIRTTTSRPTNDDIDSIIIYNHKDNKAKVQLEAWDPMRKIIPGVAQQNLDYINVSDNAIYTTSSDINQLTDPDTAWGEEQIGTRWWDTSKVKYYDYDQGEAAYKAVAWGTQYTGSEIAVWEWIKSTVAPDDYADAVKNNTEILGQVATGTAFSVYDSLADNNLYYYTTTKEWNKQTNTYSDVYYYWVKDKTTISDTRTLSAFDVANIISNPTANGVSWFAAISSTEFIIDNIKYYIDDANTVLQINKAGDKYKSHNEWTLITKDSDLIPQYYIMGMRQNLAGRDKLKNILPFQSLHRFNRYGNDTDHGSQVIRHSGQTWFNDLTGARRNAAVTINKLLQHINLDQEYKDTWDRTFIEKSFPKRLWTWHDYRLASYTGTTNHTITVTSYADLANIDKDLHLVAKISVFDTDVQRNRSEIYAYNAITAKWDLVLKKNITIQLNVGLLTLDGGWDIAAFDSTPFDQADIAEYWETIITALENDIFVHYNVEHMNTLFFSIVNHTLSSFAQTNWVRKTTYVKLELNNIIDSTTRKYKKDKISNVLGYIQEVKPFHTKVSSVVAKYAPKEESIIKLTPTESLRIGVQTNLVGSTEDSDSRTFVHIQDNTGTVVAHALQVSKETTITAPLSVDDTTISGSFGAFSATGFAYIGGELIEFAKTSPTLLSITTREVAGTFAISAAIGKSITEVAGLTFSNPATTLQYQALSEQLLQTSPSSVLAQELQALSQGITL